MFSSFLGGTKEYLGKAFVLAVWIPVLLFACAGLTVYLVASKSLNTVWQSWLVLPISNQIVLAFVFLAAITLVAFFIHYTEAPITRFFEGYWEDWPVLRTIGRWKRKRHEHYLANLDKQIKQLGTVPPGQKPSKEQMVEYNRLTDRRNLFPPSGDEAHVMPTRLGNIYKGAELYVYHRYGIEPVVIWPRLHGLLPNDFVERLQEAKIATDFFLLFGLLSVAFSLVTLPYLLVQGTDLLLIITCALGLPLGIVAYHRALASARVYAELIKVAFDLYRRTLLTALNLELPPTLSEERQLWEHLSEFIGHDIPPDKDFHFTLPKPGA